MNIAIKMAMRTFPSHRCLRWSCAAEVCRSRILSEYSVLCDAWLDSAATSATGSVMMALSIILYSGRSLPQKQNQRSSDTCVVSLHSQQKAKLLGGIMSEGI